MDLVQRARELYSSGQMHDALEAAQAACDRAPKDPEAWWLLGRIGRHVGLTAASDDAFRRAAALTARHPMPHRVSVQHFQALIQELGSSLRPESQRRLAKMTLKVQALPRVADVQGGVDPDALTARLNQSQGEVTVFQVNHENRSGSEEALRTLLTRSLGRT